MVLRSAIVVFPSHVDLFLEFWWANDMYFGSIDHDNTKQYKK